MLMSPRVRQVVLVAAELDGTVSRLRQELGLLEPFADPAVGMFGLRNAVFALRGAFLEVVSPVRTDAPAARLLERRGQDGGYMVMLQVDDLPAARARARERDVREVFEVSLPDMAEVHLHPGDMQAGIVSLSAPQPATAWRWGGPGWESRVAPLELSQITLGVSDPDGTEALWRLVAGDLDGVRFTEDPQGRGISEITVAGARGADKDLRLGSVTIQIR